jgi:hypothetical protein
MVGTSPSRLRRAIDKHGGRGLPFAMVRRAIDNAERLINPTPANLVDYGYSDVHPIDVGPVAAVYAAGFQTAVVEVGLAAIRWSRLGLGLDPVTNPFVRTSIAQWTEPGAGYDGSDLEAHYGSWHPANAAEVLGLDGADLGPIADQPPAAVILPWEADAVFSDAQARLERVDRWNRAEARGAGTTVDLGDGHKHFGPVSDTLGRMEFDRYARLTASVARNGFQHRVAEGHVGAQLLVSEASAVAVITGPGLHRAVVGAASGLDRLVLAIDKSPSLVRREDAPHWPGVRSGLFTRASAERVFDRFLAGGAHPALSAKGRAR